MLSDRHTDCENPAHLSRTSKFTWLVQVQTLGHQASEFSTCLACAPRRMPADRQALTFTPVISVVDNESPKPGALWMGRVSE